MAKLRLPTRKVNPVGIRGNTVARTTNVRSVTAKRDDGAAPYMKMVKSEKQIPDPFSSLYNSPTSTDGLNILEPPFPFTLLTKVASQNSTLPQCIEAYVVNIESYGYQLEYVGPVGEEKSSKAQKEKKRAAAFFDNPSGDTTFRQSRERSRRDLETMGNRYFEISRDLGGNFVLFDHIPGITMRMTRKDAEPTTYLAKVRNPDGDGYISREYTKYFRRYVQVGSNGKRVYFKEFGDPRPIDPATGKVNPSLQIEDQATEVYHQFLYSPGTDYGLPRWVGALPAILGTRESELVNLNFFRENAIPAMMLLISGGALTEESFDKINNVINAVHGKDAMNRILILEAAADDSVSSTDAAPPVPKIEMKPMISERQNDGLFADYQKNGKSAIRSSMRLPAIYTGDSEDYTKATAQAGQRTAEGQVFLPERSTFDEFVNTRIMASMNITQWKFKTMGPTVYDPDTLSNMIDRFAKNGALTPNIIIKIANQVIDVQIPSITEPWGDIPFAYAISMINAGQMIEGFDDVFKTIEVATKPGAPAGNDNLAALKRELHTLAARVNEIAEDASVFTSGVTT